ncbi:hypothetical protein SISSUDRAFT_1046275 [Sistotremastrum suecicum HHB10207 ss-3]|uniref:Prolyl endopeptidase n=2 Tax=Sistotremastraceae TaxID=3402574 RepID=A0A166DW03_9AGAM|nr:hypothetical protein SISSUDRAFT_1046275 [Sistotremastrum suecicum HHB10207 ss-3]
MEAFVPNAYPKARRSSHIDDYKSEKQGVVSVPDPYNWLEKSSDETTAWINSQEKYTREFLDQNRFRQQLEDEFKANTNYAKFSAPSLKGDGKWYWSYNSGLQAQAVIYRSLSEKLPDFTKEAGVGGEIFFDPNLLTEDGTASLSTSSFSQCGKYWAYGVSLSGSDFFTIYVRPTDKPFREENGKKPSLEEGRLDDILRYVKFSGVTWTHDSKGFFYQRFPTREFHGSVTDDIAGTETDSDQNAMLYYHRLGTSQEEDVLVIKDPENPTYMWGTGISEVDGRFLELDIRKDTSRKNKLWIADLSKTEIGQGIQWIKVVDGFTAAYEVIANNDTVFYFRTNENAPQYKIVSIDITNLSAGFKDFIPEDPKAFLESIHAVNNDNFVTVYKKNVIDEVHIFSATGEHVKRLAKDFVGAISLNAIRRHHTWFFATLVSFTTPGVVSQYDFQNQSEKNDLTPYRVTQVAGLNVDDFSTEQVWYSSKDGTRVPMFIVRHKSTPRDGTAAAIQYGYGGFSIPIAPAFNSSILTFLKRYGAIFAVANIRGGSEFGEEWHLAGTRERKVNCFDDFIAATDFLISSKIAAPGKVAINGGSNGGLLVAACVNRAPEGTFGAAVAEVGVLDLLKYTQFTIGRAWASDYGDPQDPHDFDFIYPISPLHNVPTDKVLPPTILLTADHDDRVVPLHSFKHAATLQHTLPHNKNPLLIRIDTKAGHGAGKSTMQRVREQADKYGFIAQTLGLSWQDDSKL